MLCEKCDGNFAKPTVWKMLYVLLQLCEKYLFFEKTICEKQKQIEILTMWKQLCERNFVKNIVWKIFEKQRNQNLGYDGDRFVHS